MRYPNRLPDSLVTRGLVACYDFLQGADAQVLYDRGPYGYNGQLGSTSGSDVNDPVWSGIGLTYGADDFVKIPAAANINDLAQITIMSALRLDGWGGGNNGRISDKTVRQLAVVNAALTYYQEFDGAPYGSWSSAAGSLSLAGHTGAVTHDRSNAANIPAFYVDGRLSATTVINAPSGAASTDAAYDLYLGNRSTADRYLQGAQGYYLEYNRILTASEIAHNHNVLRGIMARRGLVIA